MLKPKNILCHFDPQGKIRRFDPFASVIPNYCEESYYYAQGRLREKSSYIKTIVLGGLLSLFVLTMPVFAQENLSAKQEQLDKKSAELKQIENNISLADTEYKKLFSQYELAQRDAQHKKAIHQKAKDTYNKASQAADILPPEQVTQFLNDYKNVEKELKALEDNLQEIKNEKERIEGSLIALRKEKKERELEILRIRAELYEDELSKAVWVEGVGECIMDENKTIKDCEKLALEYARRDAVEKGGVSLIESVTEVKMFELTKDDIKKTAKVNIIEQDNTGDFGKVKNMPLGNTLKFTVTVRLKIQSVATYNPYQEKIKKLQEELKQVSPSSQKDTAAIDASQSTITEAEGYACMGDDKSRKQTEQFAFADAKRNAVDKTATYIKSETKVEDFVLQKDIIEAYQNATVKVLQEIEKSWYKDSNSGGDCYKIIIKAEVIPDEKAIKEIAKKDVADNPLAPLSVNIWSDKKDYKTGENIKVYLKGNKPFYACVIYKDAVGGLLQILPNPYRKDNYFNGGVLYEIPSGNDRFNLEVEPPFGEERIAVYASSSPLGDIDIEANGGVYQVKTAAIDIPEKTRAVKISERPADKKTAVSEFFEKTVIVITQQ